MATKAAMMGSFQVNATEDPRSAKAYGRGVRNFDENLWTTHLADIAFNVVDQKFKADDECRQVLMTTGDRILAEAAPNDTIWGVGLHLSDARVYDPAQWRGQNVLGFALMKVRSHLRECAVGNEHFLPGRVMPIRDGNGRVQTSQVRPGEPGQQSPDRPSPNTVDLQAGQTPNAGGFHSAVELCHAGGEPQAGGDFPRRLFLEFCCGPDSKLCNPMYIDDGTCDAVRLTRDIDMTTPEGLNFAIHHVGACEGPITLWASIPCTGGSPWQYVNEKQYYRNQDIDKLKRLKGHISLFRKLFWSFRDLAREVLRKGGIVCMEWPTPLQVLEGPPSN